MQYEIQECNTIQYITIQYNEFKHNTKTKQRNTIQLNTTQHNALQYNTKQYEDEDGESVLLYMVRRKGPSTFLGVGVWSHPHFPNRRNMDLAIHLFKWKKMDHIHFLIQYNTFQYITIQHNTI